MLCTFGSLKWESKEGFATEEIREIIKSLANRKDLVTKFPNSFFCNANPNHQGLSGFTWMTTLETQTAGKDVQVWEEVKQKKGCVLGFSPKRGRGKQGDTKEGGEKRKRSLTPNVHKPTQKMHLPPTLINLSACRAAPAQQTPPKLLLKKRKLPFLRYCAKS